jgi:hypothetical protein
MSKHKGQLRPNEGRYGRKPISRIPFKLTKGENFSSRTLKDFFDRESNNH